MTIRKTAVLVDNHNLTKSTKYLSEQHRPFDLEKLVQNYVNGDDLILKKIYVVDDGSISVNRFITYLSSNGWIVHRKILKEIFRKYTIINGLRSPDYSGGIKCKADVDAIVSTDISRLHLMGVTRLILVAGDSDYEYPLSVAKNDGIIIESVCSYWSMSKEVRDISTRCHILDNIYADILRS